MRILLVLVVSALALAAQGPLVRITNVTRPTNTDFQIGDRFEIVITGAANQPVSVRTTFNGRMDWGPVIGQTDMSGRWSATGQFEKGDFGRWSEVWTIGGKLANPVVSFSVSAPCLKGREGILEVMNLSMAETCETAEGRQTFATQSATEPFRTPDGRVIPGLIRDNAQIMQSLITGRASRAKSRQPGDEAGALIMKAIGANALNEDETRNVLSIVRAAFEKPDRIPQTAKNPSSTLLLLRNLADATDQASLKQQIAETVAYVQAQ
jgi:hypothetical protein